MVAMIYSDTLQSVQIKSVILFFRNIFWSIHLERPNLSNLGICSLFPKTEVTMPTQLRKLRTTEICFCIVSEYELQLKFNAQNVDGCMMYVSVKPHICRM